MPNHWRSPGEQSTITLDFKLDDEFDRQNASKIIQKYNSHEKFDLGNGVHGWTEEVDGQKHVFLKTPMGTHPTISSDIYDLTPQASGAMKFTTKETGSSYESTKTRDGGFIDISNYKPQAGSSIKYLHLEGHSYTSITLNYDENGGISVTSDSDIPKDKLLVKAPDGGIRTVDGDGNTSLTTLSAHQLKKQGLSKQDIADHKNFKEAAKNNPSLVQQGFNLTKNPLSKQELAERNVTRRMNARELFEHKEAKNLNGDAKAMVREAAKGIFDVMSDAKKPAIASQDEQSQSAPAPQRSQHTR